VNLLLDTQVFLWWDQVYPALTASARAAIEEPRNSVFVSAASIWEIAIKRRLGKLAFDGSATAAIEANGFLELAILPRDAEEAGELLWQHSDPFDRLLVAQAIRLCMSLVTADRAIRDYGTVALLWAG
jgi:PIN domain nuclease of toxin-antitoxin system